MKKKVTQEDLLYCLRAFNEHCNVRIDNGDPDIDDIYYKGRDLSGDLIAVLQEDK